MIIQKAGILDSFQDLGRYGFEHVGVSAGGCMDKDAAKLANWLVGNSETEAVLEMHFPGPVLFFPNPVIIALTGADCKCIMCDKAVKTNRPILLPSNTTLSVHPGGWGQRMYLAVKGGWDIPLVLGSYSTHLLAAFGGWHGRKLNTGDRIPEKYAIQSNPQFSFSESLYARINYEPNRKIRVFPGPEWSNLPKSTHLSWLQHTYLISQKNSRMGYWLNGSAVEQVNIKNMVSSAVLPGTIQLLPNGQLLILMADAQTTGGYPRVLQLADVDLPRVAQLGTGDGLQFQLISIEEAMALKKHKQAFMQSIKQSIAFNFWQNG